MYLNTMASGGMILNATMALINKKNAKKINKEIYYRGLSRGPHFYTPDLHLIYIFFLLLTEHLSIHLLSVGCCAKQMLASRVGRGELKGGLKAFAPPSKKNGMGKSKKGTKK